MFGPQELTQSEDILPLEENLNREPRALDAKDALSVAAPSRRTAKSTRLYRGLKEPYDPARAMVRGASGVDFTDCPLTALQYAQGPRGVLLVIEVDLDDHASRVTEELWLHRTAKRFMMWKSFADRVLTQIPAKELRAPLRRRGVGNAPDEDKAMILREYIGQWLKNGSAPRE